MLGFSLPSNLTLCVCIYVSLSLYLLLSCSVDPGLAAELGTPLSQSLAFFDGVVAETAPLVLEALKLATGCEAYSTEEARFAFR